MKLADAAAATSCCTHPANWSHTFAGSPPFSNSSSASRLISFIRSRRS